MESLRKYPTKIVSVLVMGLLLCSAGLVFGDEELAAFESFQRSVRAADPEVAQEEFKRDHAEPPSKQEADKLVRKLTQAAVAVADQAGEFEKQFPQSARVPQVWQSVAETLGRDFGGMGLPVPQSQAANIETCARKLLQGSPNDATLYLVLCRVAASLPKARQFALYDELSREPTPEPARTLAKNALNLVQRLGVPLELSFTALDGRVVSLSQLKGKVVLVDFWSTTCVPCVRELPELKKLYAKYQSQGLEFVGISLDSNKQQLERFIQKQEIPWPQFYDPAGPTNRIAEEFGIRSIPAVWLVDRQTRLRYLNQPGELDGRIEALLKEP